MSHGKRDLADGIKLRTLNEADPGFPTGPNDPTNVLIRVGRRVGVGGDAAVEAE